MNPVTSTGPMANSMFVVAPNNGYPGAPGLMPQVPLYTTNQPQTHLIPGNLPIFMPTGTLLTTQRVLKEGKVLGAIQMIIGLVHISLGIVMATMLYGNYISISFYGGYPFWGGLWLSSSVGLNIFSAICSAVGVILFITELCIATASPHSSSSYSTVNTGVAISSVLLIFSALEFCVTCASSHFGCQVACCQYNNAGMLIPNAYAANPVVVAEPPNSIPNHSSVEQDFK